MIIKLLCKPKMYGMEINIIIINLKFGIMLLGFRVAHVFRQSKTI